MKYKVFKEENFKTINWSGGTTTELTIFPLSEKYEERDFIWRTSKASIDVEESTFSSLKGYSRFFSVLEGSVVLSIDKKRTTQVTPGAVESFSGESKVKSYGKVIDYNLMVKEGAKGHMTCVSITPHSITLDPKEEKDYHHQSQCFFIRKGYGIFLLGKEEIMVAEGQQLAVDIDKKDMKEISVMGEGEMIWSQIDYNREELSREEIPRKRGTIEDFLWAMKIAHTNFRGSGYFFKSVRENWYDEELKKGINRIERIFLPFFVGVLGMGIVSFYCLEYAGKEKILMGILIWLIIDLFLITPGLYFLSLPKPIKLHIKPMSKLTPYEKKVYERELKENERTNRLLKKYKITGRNKYKS